MTEETSTTEEAAPTYKAGSWQSNLSESAAITARVKKADAKAQSLMWKGAQGAITSWLPKSDKDETGEKLNAVLISVLGKANKGTASKIVTIALAVRTQGLDMGDFPSLRKAYIAASAVSPRARKVQDDEDTAADEAIQSIAAPKSASSPEGAAKIVLSKGVDEAARLLLDELGPENLAAHRAFSRAVSQEIVGRMTAKTEAERAAKEEAAKAKSEAAAAKKKAAVAKKAAAKKAPAKKAAPVKAAATKAKPVPVAARVGTKAKPVAVKAKPVAKA